MRLRPGARRPSGLLLWVTAVCWLTWPLAAHLTTHLPDTSVASRFDSLFVAWALSHESRALVSEPCAFAEGNIYHPTHRTLFYGEAGFGAVPYFMPTFLLTGNPVLALNLVFLAGLALTAWALDVLVLRLTASEGAGFVAGLTFLTTPWVLRAVVPATPYYAVLQYLPLVMLLTARPSTTGRDALRLIPLVVLQGLSSPYVAAALIAPLVLLALARLARRSTRAAAARLLASLGVALPILVAAYSGYLLVRLDNPLLQQQTHWPLPATSPAPWIGPFGREAPTGVPLAAFALIGVGMLGLVARAHRRERSALDGAWRVGWFWTLAGFFLAIRPRPSWHESLLALPHSLVARLTPVYSMLRIPERLGIGGLMGLSLLAGVAFAECKRLVPHRSDDGRPRRIASLFGHTGFVLLIVALYTTVPPRRSVYGVFRPIGPDAPLTEALERSRGPLLELPAQGPWAEAASTYRSIFHRRPLLNGYSGYWPVGYAERMALARRLPNPAAVRELERTTGLRQIVVHTAGYRPEERRVWIELADRGGDATLALVARDGPDLLFDVVRGANSAQHHGPGFGTTGDARDRHERTAARVALPHSRDDTPARAAWTALAERDAGGRFALVARDGDDLPDGGGGGAPRAVPGILNRIVGLRPPVVARC